MKKLLTLAGGYSLVPGIQSDRIGLCFDGIDICSMAVWNHGNMSMD